jgi:hypothetical protein
MCWKLINNETVYKLKAKGNSCAANNQLANEDVHGATMTGIVLCLIFD